MARPGFKHGSPAAETDVLTTRSSRRWLKRSRMMAVDASRLNRSPFTKVVRTDGVDIHQCINLRGREPCTGRLHGYHSPRRKDRRSGLNIEDVVCVCIARGFYMRVMCFRSNVVARVQPCNQMILQNHGLLFCLSQCTSNHHYSFLVCVCVCVCVCVWCVYARTRECVLVRTRQ